MAKLQVLIIGCGGVGSNLAHFLTRLLKEQDKVEQYALRLVDYDAVEDKNLGRQFFFVEDIGKNKAEALAENLKRIAPSLDVTGHNLKIENEMDLAMFEPDMVAIVTDNNKSKKFIMSHYRRKGTTYGGRPDVMLVNCEEKFFEIKDKLDVTELNAWQITEGYDSTQTLLSNLCASISLTDWCFWGEHGTGTFTLYFEKKEEKKYGKRKNH